MDLDPSNEAEWAEVERAGQALLRRMLERHRSLREDACFRALPAEHARAFTEPPAVGLGVERALAEALERLEPYATGNLSPRFWGWVHGGGTLAGMLGQWLAASMNANVFAGAQGPVQLELAVLGWFRDWFRFPTGSSGIFLDGASSANLQGLAVARHWKTSGRVKRDGVGQRLFVYASTAVHSSIVKAAELLGLGSDAVRRIATNDGMLDVPALEAALDADLRAGAVPFAVVGSAGTVGIGAIDPLEQLADLCKRRELWFHVDGAIGALGYLSPKLRPRLAGLELADSLAFDLHKWGQVPYDAGGLLVRDGQLHAATFAVDASYLESLTGGVVPHGSHAFHHFTPGLSRGDRALKVWATFQAYGVQRIVGVFEHNVELARYLAQAVAAHPRFEARHEPALNIVCFRDREGDDASHERALVELQDSGFAVLSPFRLAGRACYRVALSNHRTRSADLDALLRRLAAPS